MGHWGSRTEGLGVGLQATVEVKTVNVLLETIFSMTSLSLIPGFYRVFT